MTTATATPHSTRRNLATIVSVAAVVFISKLLGLGREMVVADRFGTTAEYDLYLVAVMLPALAYGVINFASFYLLVPHLTRTIEKQQSEDSQWHPVWGLFNVTLLGALGITLLIILTSPLLMKIWAGQYLADDFSRIVFYSRVTAFMVLLGTCEAYLRALLNVKRIYTWPAGGYIIENLVFILSVLLLHRSLSVGAIVVGVLGGMLAQNIFLALRLVPLGGLRKYHLTLETGHLQVLLPTITMLIVIELLNRSYFLFDRYVATAFGAGIISGLNYCQVLVQLPDAIVGFAIASVVFPLFSASANDGRFGGVYRTAIVGGMLLTIPLAIFFVLNSSDIIQVVFLRGRFNAQSLGITSGLLIPYTPAIVALFVISTSLRAAYGRGWVKAVLVSSIAALAVKAIATLTLPQAFGYQWITVATSLSLLTFASSLFILCLVKTKGPEARELIISVVKLLLSGAVALAVGFWLGGWLNSMVAETTFAAAALRLAISASIVLAAFVSVSFALGFGRYYAVLLRKHHGS